MTKKEDKLKIPKLVSRRLKTKEYCYTCQYYTRQTILHGICEHTAKAKTINNQNILFTCDNYKIDELYLWQQVLLYHLKRQRNSLQRKIEKLSYFCSEDCEFIKHLSSVAVETVTEETEARIYDEIERQIIQVQDDMFVLERLRNKLLRTYHKKLTVEQCKRNLQTFMDYQRVRDITLLELQWNPFQE